MRQASFTEIDRDFTAPPSGCRVVRSDALTALAAVPDRTFRCCVTSPPYWGLRNYNVEQQIGAEPRLEDYLNNLRAVFAEVRRTLTDDGTLWLNIGDSYTSGGRTWRICTMPRTTSARAGTMPLMTRRGSWMCRSRG